MLKTRTYHWCFFMLLTTVTACGSLVQPAVETRMVELRDGTYELDPKHASLVFKVDHMGLSTFVGRFNDFDASLTFDPDSPEATQLDAVVYTGSIDVNDDDFSATLAGDSWFDSEQFPHARFKTTHVEFVEGNKARFSGDLTLLGVTQPITLDVTFRGGAFDMLRGSYVLGFAATTTIARSDFGMDSYIPAVGDEVVIEVHAEFLRR